MTYLILNMFKDQGQNFRLYTVAEGERPRVSLGLPNTKYYTITNSEGDSQPHVPEFLLEERTIALKVDADITDKELFY